MTSCIACRSAGVRQFLDLGRMPLANRFLTEAELALPEPTYPLRVGWCPRCTHVQLMEHVPPPAMFDEYLYMSGMSDTLRAHLHALASVVVERYTLGADDLVVDVGSNDGTLLLGFRHAGVRTLGVDPARNLAGIAADRGIETHVGYFGARTAEEIVRRKGPAAVITATNTFPHVPDLDDLIRGVDRLLRPGGVFVIEAHYLLDLLEQNAFDTVYHEHVSYWALRPMKALFQAHGMVIVHAERLPIHHGQIRVFVQRAAEGHPDATVDDALAAEEAAGIGRIEALEAFATRTEAVRDELRRALADISARAERVAAYGAPAKGSTLVCYLGLDRRSIPYIADRSPLKQGRYTPGAHIPIVHPRRILEDRPDYLLLLAWNFADEIIEQQAEFHDRGGRFILPLPHVHVVH
jgi:SAM-dependent methyltransferase